MSAIEPKASGERMEAIQVGGIMLTRHPLLRAVYNLAGIIEECGASTRLTDASCAAFALLEPINALVDAIGRAATTREAVAWQIRVVGDESWQSCSKDYYGWSAAHSDIERRALGVITDAAPHDTEGLSDAPADALVASSDDPLNVLDIPEGTPGNEQWLGGYATALMRARSVLYPNRWRAALSTPPIIAPAIVEGAAIRDIAAERQRQISVEGYTERGDDLYLKGELPLVATAYALSAAELPRVGWEYFKRAGWNERWWKPTTPRRDLVKAAALIVAEIERLDRASPPAAQSEGAKQVPCGECHLKPGERCDICGAAQAERE